MKKLSFLFISFLFIAACNSTTTSQPVVIPESGTTTTATEEVTVSTSPTAEDVASTLPSGWRNYSSLNLGLTFVFPEFTGPSKVSFSETGDTVSLSDGASTIATIRVVKLTGTGDAVARINTTLGLSSDKCSINLSTKSGNKSVFTFESLVNPYVDDVDANCQLLSNVYFFTSSENIAIVSTGQAPAFVGSENQQFLDSIKLK